MSEDAGTASWSTSRSGRWLMRYPLEVLRGLRERQTAYRVIRQCLAQREELVREQPYLFGRALYEQVVQRISGVDERAAARVVSRAEMSYANWPVERDLRFQDVVQYLAAEQCLEGRPKEEGILTPLHVIVGQQVPENL